MIQFRGSNSACSYLKPVENSNFSARNSIENNEQRRVCSARTRTCLGGRRGRRPGAQSCGGGGALGVSLCPTAISEPFALICVQVFIGPEFGGVFVFFFFLSVAF